MKQKIGFAHWLAFLLPAGLLAGAYGSQYIGGLPPCEMCWWQRYPHFAALALARAPVVAGIEADEADALIAARRQVQRHGPGGLRVRVADHHVDRVARPLHRHGDHGLRVGLLLGQLER